jgi:hypothetical protein
MDGSAQLNADGASDENRANEARKRADAWSHLLARYEPYSHFFTGTFPVPVGERAAWRDFNRYIARLESRANGAVAFAAVLAETVGGAAHIHALFKGTDRLSIADLRDSWRAGYSRAARYDPALGARHYIAQHLFTRSGQEMVGDVETSSASKFARAAGRRPPRKRYAITKRARLLYCAYRDASGRLRSVIRRTADAA